MTLVDTNVLLDILARDEAWKDWSLEQLSLAAEAGPIIMNPFIYAEVSVGFLTVERLDRAIGGMGLVFEECPREALFLAAKAFRSYRAAGGTRTGVLPDFFIGAHALVGGYTLLTRDAGRYRSYFPTVLRIEP